MAAAKEADASGVVDFESDEAAVSREIGDGADQSAVGDDAVVFLQLIHEFATSALFVLLRADQEHPEEHSHYAEWYELEPAGWLFLRFCRGIARGDLAAVCFFASAAGAGGAGVTGAVAEGAVAAGGSDLAAGAASWVEAEAAAAMLRTAVSRAVIAEKPATNCSCFWYA
jgi:hypothetical protein